MFIRIFVFYLLAIIIIITNYIQNIILLCEILKGKFFVEFLKRKLAVYTKRISYKQVNIFIVLLTTNYTRWVNFL